MHPESSESCDMSAVCARACRYVDIQGLAVDIVDISCDAVSVMKTAVIFITISIIVTVSDGCLAPPSSSSQDGIVTTAFSP